MKRIIAWLVLALSTSLVFCGIVLSIPIHADGENSPLTTKALMQGVYLCYKNAHFRSGGAKLAEYSGYSNIGVKRVNVAIPSVILDNQNGTPCADLMTGEGIVRGAKNNFNGVLAQAGFDKSKTGEAASDMLEALQYKISGDTESGNCYRMKFNNEIKVGKSLELTTNRICFYNEGGVKVYDEKDDGAKTSFNFPNKVYFTTSGKNITLHLGVNQTLPTGTNNQKILPANAGECTVSSNTSYTCPRNNGESAEDVLSRFVSYIYALGNPGNGTSYSSWSNTNGKLTYSYGSGQTITISAAGRNVSDMFVRSNMADKTYTLTYEWSGGGNTGTNTTGMKAVTALSKKMGNTITNHSDLKFTKDEMFGFYQNHMSDYWGVSGDNLICDNSAFASASDTTVWKDIKMLVDGEVKTCRARASQNTGSSIWAFTDQDYFSSTVKKSFAEVAQWMYDNGGSVDAKKVASNTAISMKSNTSTISDAEAATKDAEENPCFKGAGPLGWLACPVLDAVGGAMNWLYGYIEDVFLRLPANALFNRDDNNNGASAGVYGAWSIFQSIANIVFVIIFLVVIFSQLTGYGIDNYGIKRILPRLIVTAILVNFSFLICQILVDISNIIGASLSQFFHSISGMSIQQVSEVSYSANPLRAGTEFAIIGVAIGVAILANPTTIITLLISLFSGIIALFFMWMILIGREVGVVMAVILSPLAFICYSLPNLNSVFRRWVDLIKGLLLLYPLCSLLVGGSFFVSTIIGNIDIGDDTINSGMKLAAMLVRVIPFFALPALFRSSMRGMGNLGNTLNGLGRQFSRGARDAANRSETANRARNWMGNNFMADYRNRMATSNNRFIRGLSVLSGNTRNRRNQITAYRKQQTEDRDAQALLQRDITERMERENPEAISRTNMETEIMNLARNGQQESFYSSMSEYTRRFGGKKGAALARRVLQDTSSSRSGIMSDRLRADTLATLSERLGSQFGGNDYALNKYMQTRGLNGLGQAVDLNDFETNHHDRDRDVLDVGDISDEEAIQLDPDNIHRMIQQDIITQAQAERLKNNRELRQRMDDVQQLMFINYAETGNKKYKKKDAEDDLQTPAGANRIKPLPQEVKIT